MRVRAMQVKDAKRVPATGPFPDGRGTLRLTRPGARFQEGPQEEYGDLHTFILGPGSDIGGYSHGPESGSCEQS